MIALGIGLFMTGVCTCAIALFLDLCEPQEVTAPNIPIGAAYWTGFALVLIGGFLSGEMHL